MKTVLLMFAVAALAMATAAENYRITLFQPSLVGNDELQAGDYNLSVDGGHVVIKKGGKALEVDVKVEETKEKFKSTSVRYVNGGGKYRISEIRLGGTNRKLVFN
jgi:hypothetical protein